MLLATLTTQSYVGGKTYDTSWSWKLKSGVLKVGSGKCHLSMGRCSHSCFLVVALLQLQNLLNQASDYPHPQRPGIQSWPSHSAPLRLSLRSHPWLTHPQKLTDLQIYHWIISAKKLQRTTYTPLCSSLFIPRAKWLRETSMSWDPDLLGTLSLPLCPITGHNI
jgi:hypothetical protein